MTVKEFKSRDIVIKIDDEKCTGCGTCVEDCPVDVFELKNEKSEAVRVEDCTECCTCVEGCSESAIEHGSC